MVLNVIMVGLGGALGSMSRFLVSRSFTSHFENSFAGTFPIGTFAVNVIGCLLIGYIYTFFDRHGLMCPQLKLFLTTGFCGGFTTFSTFVAENMSLSETNPMLMLLYLVLSIVLGFAAFYFGTGLARVI